MYIEGKHTKNGIVEWRYQYVPNKLWQIDSSTDFQA